MSVKIIDTLKPKNNGSFPIVEAVDVAVTDELRLPEALESKADVSDLAETNAAVEGKASTSDLTTATANLQGQINQIEISSTAESVVAPEVAGARVGEDGTSYTTLKERLDAEYSDTNESVSEIREEVFIPPNNLYEGSIKSGGYYGTTGEWTENDTYKMAELPVGAVSSGDTLTFSEEFAYYRTSYMFDVLQSDGTWIKHYNLSQYESVTINVDDSYGPFYVAMRIRTEQDQSKLVIVKDGNLGEKSKIDILSSSVDAMGEEIDDTKDEVSAMQEGVYSYPDNLYEGGIKPNGYYNTSGEWVVNSHLKSAELPVGAVKSGDTLTFSSGFSYSGGSYLFDVITSGGVWVKHYNLTEYKPVTIIVDDNVGPFFVAMRIKTDQNEDNLIIVNNGQLTKEIRVDKLADVVIPAKNKTINCLGDSFTAPADSWCKKMETRIGCKCNNYGVASSRISVDSQSADSFLTRYSSMDPNADIVIIFGGINDAAAIKTHDIDLGDMTSELDNTTFYGALRLLIEDIKEFMPGKKIIGVIPPDFVPNANYASLPDIQEACRVIYDYYGIPYADLKKDCQEMYEDEYNNSHYRQVPNNNNYHPSELGHIAISEVIQGCIEKFIKT